MGAAIFTKSLKDLPIKLTTIVSSFDDGGSTGLIRRDYGKWAVGDFRNCLLAASNLSEDIKKSLMYRFGPGQLYGMQTGNIFIKSILNTHKPFSKANSIIHKYLNINQTVLPVSLSDSKIAAILSNGQKLVGQREIADYLSFDRAPIKKISLTKKTKLLFQAKKAIAGADFLVFGPGHFFTSILPHLEVEGFVSAYKKSKAKKIWFVNLLAHKGQDNFYSLSGYLKWFEIKLGAKPFDLLILNKLVKLSLLKKLSDRFAPIKYAKVDMDYIRNKEMKIIQADLINNRISFQQANDFIKRAPLRHNEEKIKDFFANYILKNAY